jgi:hypothetical protein
MNILVDHTSFHTLKGGAHQSPPAQAVYGVLQFFEELLLAEQVWVADTEGTRTTFSQTYEVLHALQDVGLSNPTNTGLVRVAHFSHRPFRNVVENAGATLSDYLILSGGLDAIAEELRARGRVDAGPLIPAGVIPMDFHGLVKMAGRRSTRKREEVLEQALADQEINHTLAPFLISEALYSWLVSCTSLAPERTDPIYTHLVTLARLSINSSLADALSKGPAARAEEMHVWYTPAYARAMALARNYLPSRASQMYFLRDKLADLYDEAHVHRTQGAIPYAATFRMPVLGAWLMLSLPKDATLVQYFEKIAELRQSDAFIALRNWLAGDPSPADVNSLIQKVQRQLKVQHDSAVRKTVWASFSLTRIPDIGIKVERDISGIALKKLLAGVMKRRRIAALLTGCLEKLLEEPSLAQGIVTRTERLIAPTRPPSKGRTRRKP